VEAGLSQARQGGTVEIAYTFVEGSDQGSL
jgi:hypothetical protein